MKKIYLFKMFLMAFVLMLLGGVNASAETSTLTFTGKCGGSGTANDNVTWTVASDAAETNFDDTRGIHYGSGTKTVSYLTLTTSDISGTISKIVVNATAASGTSAKLDVTVNDVAFGTQKSLTKDATEYTFEGSATGEIVVKLSQTSTTKALYVKSISVTYETSSTPTTNFKYSAIEYNAELDGNNTFPKLTNDYGTAVTYNSSNTSVATIDEKKGNITLVGVGTTTITATLKADNKVTASYTLNVSQTHTWDLSKIDYISQSENEVVWSSSIAKMVLSKESSQTKANNYLGNSDNTETRVYKDQQLTITPIDGIKITKVIITSTESKYQGYFAVDKQWTNATTSKGSNNNNEVIVTPTDGTQSIIFTVGTATRATKVIVYYTGEPTVENKTLVATDSDGAYYATFSCDRDVVFTEDVNVYAVNVTEGKLELAELTKGNYNTTNSTTENVTNGYYVPANTGVLISATKQDIKYYTAATGQTHASLPNNQLVAATADGMFTSDSDHKYYKLAYDNYVNKTGLGFYYGAADGAAFEVKKGLAYLAVPVNGSKPAAGYAFGGNGGDDTTGINGIENDNVNETQTIYNLQGQRVEKAGLRGIYIVNGKKVVLK